MERHWGIIKSAMLHKLDELDLEFALFKQFFMDPTTLNCVVNTENDKIVLYSPLWLELTGLSSTEFENMPFSEMIKPEDLPYTMEIYEKNKLPESDGRHERTLNEYEVDNGPFWPEWINAVKSAATKENPKGGKYMMCNAIPSTYERYIEWKRKKGLI